jgi:gluconate 2-dehydrogenase
MKPTATLTNIAPRRHRRRRGLAGRCATARSPPPGSTCSRASRGHPDLLTVPNVVLTPHIASASLPTRRAMAELAATNLIAALDSRPGAPPPPTALNPRC